MLEKAVGRIGEDQVSVLCEGSQGSNIVVGPVGQFFRDKKTA